MTRGRFNPIPDHAFDKTVTFIVRKKGTDYEAIYGYDSSLAGKLVANSASTDALVTCQAIEAVAVAYDLVHLKIADFVFSATWTPSTYLCLEGEGKKTRLLSTDGFAAIDSTLFDLNNLVWFDADGNEHDETFVAKFLEYSWRFKGHIVDLDKNGGSLVDGSASVAWDSYAPFPTLATGATSNSTAQIRRDFGSVLASWNFDRLCRAIFRFTTAITSSLAWIYFGDLSLPKQTTNQLQGFGIYVQNGNVYGYSTTGTVTEEEIVSMGSIVPYTDHRIECVFKAGQHVKFYIDGIYKGLAQTFFPSGTGNSTYSHFLAVTNTIASNRAIKVWSLKSIMMDSLK